MSNLFGSARALADPRSVPDGDTVGSYVSYLDAQKAVDYLADQQFPVQLVSIVGNDLKMVERVTGKLSYPRVALNGAMTGAWFGLFVGLLLSFIGSSPGGALLSIPIAMVLGAAFWMLFGIVTYAAQRGKRDFTSTSQVLASNYDVIVAREASAEARRLLQNLPMGSRPTTPSYPAPTAYRPPQAGQSNLPDQSAAPQRPEGWADPYGQPAADSQSADPQASQPVAGVSGVKPGSYADLPDGRPQYGVRLEPTQPAATPSGAPVPAPASSSGVSPSAEASGPDERTDPEQPTR
ncbi:general stress protein [Psychromicrobium lacuslunae]|uniref:general stress protein n=1 Tax=Psychromicrobium lacuslunae TaxID=1618207 RepID=UPI001F35CBD2|nr:general stress protein [Psychromicrobium lacuslunae]